MWTFKQFDEKSLAVTFAQQRNEFFREINTPVAIFETNTFTQIKVCLFDVYHEVGAVGGKLFIKTRGLCPESFDHEKERCHHADWGKI